MGFGLKFLVAMIVVVGGGCLYSFGVHSLGWPAWFQPATADSADNMVIFGFILAIVVLAASTYMSMRGGPK